jgi:hypothetical protein
MRRGKTTWGEPIVIVCIAMAFAALGATQVARAKTKHRYPPGTVKLSSSKIKRVRKVVCGKIGGKWVSGTLVAPHRFLSDSRQQQNYLALARKAHGSAKKKSRKKDLRRADFYRRRSKADKSVCNPKPRTTPPPPTTAPEPAPSIFGIDTSTYDTSQANFDNDIPASASLGARWDRFTAGADPGAGDYSALDYEVAQARAHGMGVLISFAGIASACSSGTTPVNDCMPSSSTDLSSYQAFMKTLILRYQSDVEYYESWIEPNNPPSGSANPLQYATLLKAQYAEIQSINSQYGLHVKLLLGSPIGFGSGSSTGSNVFPWIDQVLTDLDGQKPFDGAALHAYRVNGTRVYGPDEMAPDYVGSNGSNTGCAPTDDVCTMNWTQELQAYENVFTNNGYANTSLWLTEFGWPGGGPYDESQQSTDLQEAYADLLPLPFVEGALWFNIHDYAYETGDPQEFWYMGLLNSSFTPKPAAGSFTALAAANPGR